MLITGGAPARRLRGTLICALVLAACLLLSGCPLLMVAAVGIDRGGAREQPVMAADFAFTAMDGSAANLSDFRGQPVVLNFWADWCPPCIAEFPAFQQAYSGHPGEFMMLSIAAPNSIDAPGFVGKHGYDWLFAIGDMSVLQLYAITAIPDTLFINRAGRVIDRRVGGMSHDEFEASLALILD